MAANEPKPSSTRLLSLDVMRGFTIMAMILVNNPGSWGSLYWPLGHADWHGWTPTDLIFPFFVFMVGVAMNYSFKKYTSGAEGIDAAVWLRIARRVVALILLGLLLNWSGTMFNLLLGNTNDWGLSTLRLPGVLQRIALAYLGAALFVLLLKPKQRFVGGAILLVGYALLLSFCPPDVLPEERWSQEHNVVRAVDLKVLGADHMWTGATSRPTDPEGLLSTLPAIVTALFGYATGAWLQLRPVTAGRVVRLFVVGLLVAASGIAWDRLGVGSGGVPINKALWTSSFVLLTAGLGMASLALCLLVFDVLGKRVKPVRRVATLFEMVGVNAIFVFVASGLVARLLTVLKIGDQTVKDYLYQHVCVAPLTTIGLEDPKLHSLLYALLFVGCWQLVLWGMWRKGWSIRV